jgi:hypothetical protein
MKISRRVAVSRKFSIVLVLCAFFLLGSYQLETFPAVWWDEGWTLAVARNWVEFGHYGQMLMGEPRGPGLSAAFPVVAPVALSFKLFGVGIWQGRLPGLFFTLGAIVMMVYLAEVLYNRKVAIGTLFVLLFMQGHEHLNPLLVGRQVLGEMPLMFYLLAGYVFFLFSLKRSYWFLLPAVFFWGIAIKTKAQVLPFWAISLLAPLGVALLKRWWKYSFLLVLCLFGSWLMGDLVLYLQRLIINEPLIAEPPLDGLFEVTAFVLDFKTRERALIILFFLGLPTILGYLYSGKGMFHLVLCKDEVNPHQLVSLELWTLGSSWLLWYATLGSFWYRYLFPAVFIGSIFVGFFLYDLFRKFNIEASIRKENLHLQNRLLNRRSLAGVIGIIIIEYGLFFTIFMLPRQNFSLDDQSLNQVISFFNMKAPPNAIIETYDSELFFLLKQDYHYPPDQTHIIYNQKSLYRLENEIDYDPLNIDPDFLVIGPFSRSWRVYNDILSRIEFQLLFSTSLYHVYERVRIK